jgi:hypothetical protein
MPKVEAKPEMLNGDIPVIEIYPGQHQVRILDVALDVLPLPDSVNARRFIPPWKILEAETCWDTPTVLLIRDMAIRLKGGISTRNEGPTGVSKSFAIEVICALTNRSYLRHNYSHESDVGDTIGRFVPADEKLAVRFEELLSDNDIPDNARKMIEKAQAESRSLTLYESKKVAKILGIELSNKNPWKWKNGTLTGAMAYGTVYGADERNLAPGNIMERENSAVEKHPTLRLVEHEGEVIRELTPEETSIINDGGIIPGVIGLNYNFWFAAAQNPYGIGGGRTEESEASRNRLQDRIVESLTAIEYQEFLSFLVHGDQPNIVWHNRKYHGAKDCPTKYREMEKIPNIDVLIDWVAKFQSDLQKLTESGEIGSEKDIKGGSYVYTRRNLLRFLDSIKGAKGALLDVEETIKQKRPVLNNNWHDLVAEAIYQEYVAGMYRDDQNTANKLIEAAGILDQIGNSKNNPSLPEWVKAAQKKGLNVTAGQKGYEIS